ncbi:methylsterol monooxygenase 1-like [Halichondria panicea]|uniref:methylsterol monooxygenase 1-like n=1 Tax=Halichondria panicea TaxID=6063 RepID=UPI00312B7907
MSVDSDYILKSVYETASIVGNSTVPFEGYVKTGWNAMTDRYSHFTIAVLFSVILHEITYFGLSTPGFLAQFLPFMRRFKIQEKPESTKVQWNCFVYILLNHFFIQAPMIAGMYHFNYYMGVKYEYDDIPRWYVVIPQLVACLMIEDTWHYFMHRLLHHKRIYKHIHKIHHHHQQPFGLTAEYAHPLETVILGMGFVWGILFFGNHVIMEWLWMMARLVESVEVHSGYDFPYLNPMHLIPGYAGARFHDFHHYNFNGNYASSFVWWDWIFGTNKQYLEYIEKQPKSKKE